MSGVEQPGLYAGQPSGFVVEQATTVPISGKKQPDSWLDQQHPDYKTMLPRWQMVSDFYLGEVADEVTARKYLIRRFQGEADKAFDERVRTVDFTPHLGTLLDTVVGMLFAVEHLASRVWKDEKSKASGLGDPADGKTTAGRLIHDANGQGVGWITLWKQFALDLVTYQVMWVLVDTVDEDTYVVKLIPPTLVPNWIEGPTGVKAVLLKECRDLRDDLKEKYEPGEDTGESFVLWEQAGWSRWKKGKDGEPVPVASAKGEPQQGNYRYVDRAGRPTLPIFPVRLPMRRYVAWLLAKKAQVLFNQESVRDFGLRIANFAKLVLDVTDEAQYENLITKLLEGQNVLPHYAAQSGNHAYINPSSEPTTNATEVLNKKIEDFWLSGFKMLADAARERTATEIKQEVAGGVGAFLQLLKTAVDDAENGAFYRLEQAELSETPEAWGTLHVERADDFSAVDLGAILDTMRKRYIGGEQPMPLGRSSLIALAKDSARQDGLPVEDGEIEAAIDAAQIGKFMANAQALGITPPEIKAAMLMKLVAAMNIVDPKQELLMSNGQKRKLLDVMQEQATELARAQDEAQRREAELPAFGGA